MATPRKRKKKMADEPQAEKKDDPGQLPEVVKERADLKNQVQLSITRPGDGQSLSIFIKAPVLAEIIRKMDAGNYPFESFQEIYHPVLVRHPKAKDRIISRPAITRITKNFASGTDFSFSEPPRACLLHNPDLLAEGYTLTYKVSEPIPPDLLRKWGKQFMEGCQDIISNARPFKMNWVMNQVEPPAFR
jgi:hypothetical protein